MKKTMATLMVATLLMSLATHALEARSEDEVREMLNKNKVENDERALNRDKSLITSNLASIAPNADARNSAGLSKTLPSSEGPVIVLSVADSLVKSHQDLKDSRKVALDLDAGGAALKANLDAGLEVYAKSVGLIASEISQDSMYKDEKNPKTYNETMAVAKVLLMGQEMALGHLNAEQVKQYTELVQAMHDLLVINKGMTAQQALRQALSKLGYDADGKIDELLKCKRIV